ncbi:DUF2089 domain-containing protein [Niallia sp. FSL W8-0635]|uniref:DUF2089 domain-containing protein n=1 Tax=Niallia sp. FSL W8-0635 TaxID=2975337 RepID=UPI0009C5B97D|nr:Protein of uncharacterised function(DUF2089) [Mycobacteroides abscessus subsp. abscessus]HEO8419382.1 DUF2089 domain-containing protein [Yersinia enterocolitica]
MHYPVINDCPVCHQELHVTRLECGHCHTTIENRFHLSKWHSFSEEQMHFIETFILSRGSIKEVEKKLGISYPTVRGKLDDIIQIMTEGEATEGKASNKSVERKADILEKLENNEITADEAIRLMKDL